MADLMLNIAVKLDWTRQDRIDTGYCLVTKDYDVYTVSATVMRDGTVMDCTAYTARIRFLRDDNVAVGESICTVGKTAIVANIPNVAFDIRGTVTAEISLYEGSIKRRTLQPFFFTVRPSIDTDATLNPVDKVIAIDQMLNAAQENINNKTQESEELMSLLLEDATAQATTATRQATLAATEASNAATLVDQAEALLAGAITSTPITGMKTVTSTPAEVFAGASAKAGRTKMLIRNESDVLRIRIGGSSVTQQNGFPMEPGATVELSFHPDIAVAVYAVSEGAATKIGVMEF